MTFQGHFRGISGTFHFQVNFKDISGTLRAHDNVYLTLEELFTEPDIEALVILGLELTALRPNGIHFTDLQRSVVMRMFTNLLPPTFEFRQSTISTFRDV